MTLKAWLHGIFAAFISTFATSLSGALALPTVFNLSHDGLCNMVKMAGIPATIAVLAILKQSPLPTLSVETTTTHTDKTEVTPGN